MSQQINNSPFLLEVICDIGAGRRGASLGAQALFFSAQERTTKNNKTWFDGLRKYTISADHHCLSEAITTPNAKYLPQINNVVSEICNLVHDITSHGERCVLVSGDHSTAFGSVAGLKQANPDKRIGVVWIDAHADIHSPYTTPSGNVHGMPLAAICQLDHLDQARNKLSQLESQLWKKYQSIGGEQKKVDPGDVVYIAARDIEPEEAKVLKNNNMTLFTTELVNELGAKIVSSKVLKQLAHCDLIYVTFDVDSLDSSFSMGTGVPVANGLTPQQVTELLTGLLGTVKTRVFEITEINPLLDNKNRMANLVNDIVEVSFEKSGFLISEDKEIIKLNND